MRPITRGLLTTGRARAATNRRKISASAPRQAASGTSQTNVAAAGLATDSVVAAIPEHPKAKKREDRPGDRKAAPLPGCARLSERDESDESADKSVERARQAIEQFAADVAEQRRIRAVSRVGRHQLRGRTFARPLDRAVERA